MNIKEYKPISSNVKDDGRSDLRLANAHIALSRHNDRFEYGFIYVSGDPDYEDPANQGVPLSIYDTEGYYKKILPVSLINDCDPDVHGLASNKLSRLTPDIVPLSKSPRELNGIPVAVQYKDNRDKILLLIK